MCCQKLFVSQGSNGHLVLHHVKKQLRLAPQACPTPVQSTNWDICVVCQEHSRYLISPTATGHASMAANISSPHELHKAPLKINVSRFNDGMKETLATHRAKWHKACYVLCNATSRKSLEVTRKGSSGISSLTT